MFSVDFNLKSLSLVVLLGRFSMGEGETDDGIITTPYVEVIWIGKDEVGGTYNIVGISWVDIDVEVCWTDTDVKVS